VSKQKKDREKERERESGKKRDDVDLLLLLSFFLAIGWMDGWNWKKKEEKDQQNYFQCA